MTGNYAYSQEEFNESFDEDERSEYFTRGGMYDITCLDCKGKNVVLVIDEDACVSEEQKAILVAYLAYEGRKAQDEAEDRRTYYYESGGMDY